MLLIPNWATQVKRMKRPKNIIMMESFLETFFDPLYAILEMIPMMNSQTASCSWKCFTLIPTNRL